MNSAYAKLSTPECIRVINIEAASNDNAPLICSLEKLDIIGGTGYRAFSALSYRWGDGSRPRQITLNGFPLHIGQNLYDFLMYARRAGWSKHL